MGVSPAVVLGSWVDGLDRALFQKVLPKIHGNRSALGDSLKALATFLDGGAAKYSLGVNTIVQIEAGKGLSLPSGSAFKISTTKLLSMHDRLVTCNSVSFVR
jgi:hypothetical protein